MLLNDRPQVIIRDGALIEANLRRDRITRLEVEAEMRLAGIAHMHQVTWAILETQGKISFIRKDDGDVKPKR
ncbi:YetF domain-containing protein [Sphingomonas phyllosphaerae]|uniref:YetF domain-containing protein n=1 Tax=Sphingomonas phyllosphaerae TaxID=257003 RepID=UPI0006890D12|nr:YetF domain-containing protein [Sphingomonas phyllosphaerae]